MNRYLMVTAAALLGGTASAFAGEPSRTHTIHFLTSNGGAYCDGMRFERSNASPIYQGSHLLHTGCGYTYNTPVSGDANKRSVLLFSGIGNQTSYVYEISRPI